MTVKDAILTLWVEQDDSGQISWSVVIDDESRSAFGLRWLQDVDPERLEEEREGLLRSVRRRVERAREAPGLEGHARMLFDLLFL